MKKIFALFTAFSIFASIAVSAAPIYTATEEEIMTGGVSVKNEQRFFGDYSLNINCVTADLKNEHLKLELLKHNGGSDKVATVRTLANSEEDTVVAINADFFSKYKGDQNFSLGIEIKDGELLQSHINPDMAAGLLKDGALSFSYLEFKGEVEAPDGTKMPIAHINKPTDYYGSVLMYTPEFNGGVSPFLPNGITVITVTDDIVTAKGVSMGGTVPIPEDGYILVIDDNMTPFLDYKFNVDDKAKVTIEFDPSVDDIETAFGGGTMLLKDGKKTKITHQVSGNNPRSAIGTNEDGTVIYMITVDGRQTSSRGVTLDELADICLDMGCVNAINLDGGGSTAMVGKTFENGELHNINKPTEARSVINAVAITSDAEPGVAAGFFIEAESDYVLAGDSVALKITAYDENYNHASKIPGKVSIKQVHSNGSVKNNIYYPKNAGKEVLEIYYNGKKTDSCTVNVIKEVSGIIAPKEVSLGVGEAFDGAGKIKVFDRNGKTAIVKDLTLLYPKFDPELVSLGRNGEITALKEGASEIKLVHGTAKRSIEVLCGDEQIDGEKVVVADSMQKETSTGFSLDVFSANSVTTLFDRLVYRKAMQALEESEVAVVLGGEKDSDLVGEDMNLVEADSWSQEDYFNSRIITIKQDSGKFARGDQWKKFVSAVQGAKADNVFIVANESIGFISDLDRQAFHSLLCETAKEKNVFVIYSGSENFCRIADGIRYITVADPRQEDNIHDTVKNACYLSFKITSNDIFYSFKKLFD